LCSLCLFSCSFYHGGTEGTEYVFFFLFVFSVSLWLYLFTTEAQSARSMFSSFSLCSQCLCGYIFSPRRHRGHEVCFLLSLCVLSVSVVISFHHGGTERTEYLLIHYNQYIRNSTGTSVFGSGSFYAV